MNHRRRTIRHAKLALVVGIALAFMMPLFEARTGQADDKLNRPPAIALSTIQMIGSHNSYKKAMPANVMVLLEWVCLLYTSPSPRDS